MCVTPLRAGSTLLVLLQTAVKPAAAQSQSLGRLADVSLEPRQRFLDQVALDFFERSEEHTSELQSPCNLVCRLLLEKKKTQNPILIQRTSRNAMAPSCRHD